MILIAMKMIILLLLLPWCWLAGSSSPVIIIEVSEDPMIVVEHPVLERRRSIDSYDARSPRSSPQFSQDQDDISGIVGLCSLLCCSYSCKEWLCDMWHSLKMYYTENYRHQ